MDETRSDADSLPMTRSETRNLLALAWPLILSNSFTTLQITIDRLFLSELGSEVVGGTLFAVALFWTPFVLFHFTANYVTTFVAQYTGANRPDRVGPAVWQGIWFSVITGILWIAVAPFAAQIVALAGHSPQLQLIESTYFACLCWMALPSLIVASISGFFSGRGDSRTILWINGTGLIVNAFLAWSMIFGKFGLPAMGVAGAGWATVIAMWVSALLGLGLMLRRRFRAEHGTLAGWRFDPELFKRVMRFGIPSGFQWMLDMSAFTGFIMMMGWFGNAQISATGFAITINNFAFIPMLGVGQAVSILVGQRLTEGYPEKAEQSTYAGFWVAGLYMLVVGMCYVLLPGAFIEPFRSNSKPEEWAEIAEHVRVLLLFVAIYSLFDAMNIVFSFALRGAGDTIYVTCVSLVLAWPVMVLPTWLAWKYGWSMYWAWGFASLYIGAQATCFLLRFRGGKWKSMRVIEQAPAIP